MSGRIDLTIGGRRRRLSLYRAYTRLMDLDRQYQARSATERLSAVADLLAEMGFPDSSLWMAGRFVRAINNIIERLRARGWGLAEARLAGRFGAGVFGSRPKGRDLLKLAIHEQALWAEGKLRDTPGLTADAVKALTLLATGSEDAADDAWAKAVMQEMRAAR